LNNLEAFLVKNAIFRLFLSEKLKIVTSDRGFANLEKEKKPPESQLAT
jgi:hypothetical protein